jgi:hypothetical protein
MNHLWATLSGMGVLAVAGLVNPQGLGMLLLLSIVCTAGLGLIVWLPVSWAIGWPILLLFRLILDVGSPVRTPADAAPAKRAERDVQALAHFLRQARLQQRDDASAVAHLRRSGWSDDVIAEAQRSS